MSCTAGFVLWPLGKMSVNSRSVMKSRRAAGARRKSARSLPSCDGMVAVVDFDETISTVVGGRSHVSVDVESGHDKAESCSRRVACR
jgi:hypothetical protein